MNESEYRRRNSIRLQNYDYSSPGAYFITICTKNRRHLFGKIWNGIMHLNHCGEIVLRTWNNLPGMYPSVLLDAFVVMPDHVHGIIILPELSDQNLVKIPTGSKRKAPISEIISWYKRSTTHQINHMHQSTGSIWKRSYYDRIIWSEQGLNAVRIYIHNNPRKWHGK